MFFTVTLGTIRVEGLGGNVLYCDFGNDQSGRLGGQVWPDDSQEGSMSRGELGEAAGKSRSHRALLIPDKQIDMGYFRLLSDKSLSY